MPTKKKSNPNANEFLVQTLLTAELIAWVQERAKQNSLSVSSWLRLLITEAANSSKHVPLRARLGDLEARVGNLEKKKARR